jgi:hypothetical protein
LIKTFVEDHRANTAITTITGIIITTGNEKQKYHIGIHTIIAYKYNFGETIPF